MSDVPPNRNRLKAAFLTAVGLSVVLHLVQPYGRYALYPFSFLATWAHEMGHGLTALCLGGSFKRLVLFSDLGGYATHTAVGFVRGPLVAMGGLLGPAVAGGAVIVCGARSERSARITLGALAVLVALSLVIWVRPFVGFGFLALGGIGVALSAVAFYGNTVLRLFLTQLIGIQLCLGSLGSFDYMFTKDFERDGERLASDTQSIAEHWLLPYWVWGSLIAAASILILVSAFYVAWIRPERKPAAA
ncbi:MAG: M50 family metallopeptidase [Planctomycetes bacterium]|nr:M50 family metallopeptidase [Planctomycetota bacterium]